MHKRMIANIAGQFTAYGTSIYGFATHLSDTVSIASGLAGAILTLVLAWGNYKIKQADARYRRAEAEALELKNRLTAKKLDNE